LWLGGSFFQFGGSSISGLPMAPVAVRPELKDWPERKSGWPQRILNLCGAGADYDCDFYLALVAKRAWFGRF